MKQPGFWQSLIYAWSGLVFTIRTQQNARIHLMAGSATVILAIALGIGTTGLSILVLTIGAVIAVEMLNTALEAVVDLLSPEWHQQAKVAKDVAAGAVLTVSLAAIIIGLLILGPALWDFVAERFKASQ